MKFRQEVIIASTASLFVVVLTGGCGSASDGSKDADASEDVVLAQDQGSPERPPEFYLGSVAGVSLYRDWAYEDGTSEQLLPPATIEWPQTEFNMGAIVMSTPIAPIEFEMRYFLGELDRNGEPLAEPVVKVCTDQGASESSFPNCSISRDQSETTIMFEASPETRLLILNVRWFVSAELLEKSPEAAPTNAIAVGWMQSGTHTS